jgi:hypothetical protein
MIAADDPLLALRRWFTRCQPPASAETAAILSVTIGEIVQLRAVVEKLRAEHALFKAVVTGRPRVRGLR